MSPSPTNRISTRLFEITIMTYPGLGVFEASVSKDIRGKYKVSGAISRTNLYGKQSHCVKEATIRLFCYCKDLEEN
ncbi:unnamed protein product [Allacma fusca]|uniref:Uncharacterized protein n=1 Tax=Allacma fusca TaxID=39272 RepID=A0A8J2PFM0_9HEXA|nr:unnamed protein product [Allacma fusca]